MEFINQVTISTDVASGMGLCFAKTVEISHRNYEHDDFTTPTQPLLTHAKAIRDDLGF